MITFKCFVMTTVLSGVMTIVKQSGGMSSEIVEENDFLFKKMILSV